MLIIDQMHGNWHYGPFGTLEAGLTSMLVDFDEVRKNAAEAGISLMEIAIFYEDLTDEESDKLRDAGLITHGNGHKLIARFAPDGSAMFPAKAIGVRCLSA